MKASNGFLEATVQAAGSVLTLPLWIEMSDATVMRVSDSVRRIQRWLESRKAGRAQRDSTINIDAPADANAARTGNPPERAQG